MTTSDAKSTTVELLETEYYVLYDGKPFRVLSNHKGHYVSDMKTNKVSPGYYPGIVTTDEGAVGAVERWLKGQCTTE